MSALKREHDLENQLYQAQREIHALEDRVRDDMDKMTAMQHQLRSQAERLQEARAELAQLKEETSLARDKEQSALDLYSRMKMDRDRLVTMLYEAYQASRDRSGFSNLKFREQDYINMLMECMR